MMPTVSLSEFCRFVAVLAEIYTKSAYEPQVLEQGLEKYALRDWIDGRLAEIIFDIREEERETVYEPEAEKKFLSYVTKGNVEALQNFKLPKAKAEDAKETKYQNLFEAVALVTLATRAAISGGLDYVEAFSLSDLYFKRLSRVTNDKELSEIIPQILTHFAQRVKESSHRASFGGDVALYPSKYSIYPPAFTFAYTFGGRRSGGGAGTEVFFSFVRIPDGENSPRSYSGNGARSEEFTGKYQSDDD